jgi:hypothetical protein
MTRGICPICGSWADFGIDKSWQVKSGNAFGTIYTCPNCYHDVDDKEIKKYQV